MIGNFFRDGELHSQERIDVNDHDFRSLSDGIVIPHALYDLSLDTGYITLGASRDTSEFACERIRLWWKQYGKTNYASACSILILCDCGGSNSSRYYIFKENLQAPAEEIGMEIRIAHYPPYTSKYNPVEHRLFPHVTRACNGLIFKDIEIVQEAMASTKTKQGLKTFVSVLKKVYETGKKVTEGFKENMKILFDDFLPKWNYRAVPQQ